MSVSYSVEIKNAKELEQAMRKYPKIAQPIVARAIKGAEAVLHGNAKEPNVPAKTRRLIQSFEFERKNPLSTRFFPTVKYAIYVHRGTRPHIIRYKGTGRGGLYNQKTKTGFGRVVNHPGTEGNPFMAKILEQSQSKIDSLFEKALDGITKEVARQASS